MKIVKVLPVLLLLVGGLALAGCSTSAADKAAEKQDIDAGVGNALQQFYKEVKGSQALVKQAQGVLVFPNVYKGGIIVGGEYGEGALQVNGRTEGYYDITSASFGLTLGGQAQKVVILFMTPQALADFRKGSEWQPSAAAGVTAMSSTAATSWDPMKSPPVVTYVFGVSGLLGDASIAGSKISKLDL